MPNQIQLKDAEQDQEIALLKHRVDELEESGVDELRQRVRKLEKTVWGASAVVAAVISLLGLAIAADSKTLDEVPTFEPETKVGVFTDQIRRYEIERERTPAKFVIDKALLEWLQWEQWYHRVRKSCYNFRVVEINRVVDGDTIDVTIDLGFDLYSRKRELELLV